jgi:hypothetical protein
MFDWEYFLNVSWPALVGLLIPILGFVYLFFLSNQRLALNRRTGAKYLILTTILTLILFFVLIFFTGGIIQVFFQETGFFVEREALLLNVTEKLTIIIRFDTGVGFFAVAILSGLTYAGLLIFPPVCKVDFDETVTSLKSSNVQTATNSVSTIIAGSSALASGVACCSTSLISVISPAFATFLAPYSSILVILSIFLLDFNLFRQIFPRYPTKSVK